MDKTREKIISTLLSLSMIMSCSPGVVMAMESSEMSQLASQQTEITQEESTTAPAPEPEVKETAQEDKEAEKKEKKKEVTPPESKEPSKPIIKTEETKAPEKEESAEDEEETKEPSYPAQTFTENAGIFSITATAKEGSLPEGTKMHVKALSSEEALDAVSSVKNIENAEGFSVSFAFEGKSVEPKSEISLAISCNALSGSTFRFYKADGSLTPLASAKATGGNVSINGDSTLILCSMARPLLKAATPQSEDAYTVKVGQTVTITGTEARYQNSWASSNSSVASVNDEGVVRGVSEGSVTITHTYRDTIVSKSRTESFEVNVIPAPKISLDTKELKVTAGNTNTVNAVGLVSYDRIESWTIGDNSIASISPNGEECSVTGLKRGKTTLTVRTKEGATATADITVKASAPVINENAKMMIKTDTFQIRSEQPLTYKSSDESVATVTAGGLVTAVGEGDAVITATAEDGGVAFLTLTVLDLSIETEPATMDILSGQRGYIYPYVNGNKDCHVEVETSEDGIVSCEYNNKTDVCTITPAETNENKAVDVTVKLVKGDTVIDTATTHVTVLAANEESTYHKVEFQDEYNTSLTVSYVEDGESVRAPKAETRDGKTFTGYRCEDTVVASEGMLSNVTGDMVFKAEYERNVYTVSYTTEHGEAVPSQEVNENAHVILPKHYVKGYEVHEGGKYWQFMCWRTDDGEVFDQTVPVTEDLHLTAEWKKVTQDIYFLTYDGVFKKYTVDKGATGSIKVDSLPSRLKSYTYTSSSGISNSVTFRYWANNKEMSIDGNKASVVQHKDGFTYEYENLITDEFFNAVYDPTNATYQDMTNWEKQDDYARLTLTVIDQFGNHLGEYKPDPMPVYYDKTCTMKVYDAHKAGLINEAEGKGLKQGYVNLAKDLGRITIGDTTYVLSDDNIITDDFRVTWLCHYNDSHSYGSSCSGGTWTSVGVIKVFVEEYVPENMSKLYVNYIGVDSEGREYAIDKAQEELPVGTELTSGSHIKGFSAYAFKNLEWVKGEEGINTEGGKSYTLNIYYQTGPYDLTVNYVKESDGSEVAESVTKKLDFKEEYKVASPEVEGYTANKLQVRGAMGKGSAEYDVLYAPNEDTNYTVEYYYEGEDGSYPSQPSDTKTKQGTTDSVVNATSEDKTPKTNNYLFDEANAGNVLSGTVSADGSLTLKVYFKQKAETKLSVTSYSGEYDGAAHSVSVTAEEGATVTYSLNGGVTWSEDAPSVTDVNASIEGLMVKAEKEGKDAKIIENLSISVLPRKVTVTVKNAEKTYGEATPSLEANITDGTLVKATDLGDLKASRTSENENAGTYKNDIDVIYTANDNYDVTVVKGNFTIKKADSMVLTVGNRTKTYDAAPLIPTVTANVPKSEYTLMYSKDGGETWTDEVPYIHTVSESRTFMVKAISDNYETVTKEFELNVLAKKVTVTANDVTKYYNEFDPEFTAKVEGLIGQDSISYSIGRDGGEAVGTYLIHPTGSNEQGNYEITYKTGTLEIKKQSISPLDADAYRGITISPAEEFEYDGLSHKWIPTVESSLKNPLTEGVDYKVSYDTEDLTNAKTVTVTIEGIGGYTGVVTRTYDIAPRKVTIKANNESKYFGQEDPEFTGSIVNGSLVGPTDLGTIRYERIGNQQTVGKYEGVIIPIYSDNDNYDVTTINGDFEIAIAKGIGLKVGNTEKPYDKTPLNIDVTTAVTEGTTIYYSYDGGDSWAEYAPYLLDSDTISCKIKAVNPSYETEYAEATFSVTPLPAQIEMNPTSKVYKDPDPEFTATITGLLEGDELDWDYFRGDVEDVGSWGIWSYDVSYNPNYNVNHIMGPFEIRPQSIETDAEDYRGVEIDAPENALYDGNEHKWTPVVTDKDGNPLTEGTDYELSYSTDDFTNAGTISVTVHGIGNYTGVVTKSYNIAPRSVVIKVESASKAYGEDDPEFKVTVSGDLVSETDFSEARAIRTNDDEAVGTYKGVLDAVYNANDNYKVTVVKGDFVITKQSIPESAVDTPNNYTYDGQRHAWEPVIRDKNGNVLEKDEDYELTYSTDNLTDAGKITVTITGIGDYSGTVTREYEITKRDVQITVFDNEKFYGADDPWFDALITDGYVISEEDLGIIHGKRTNDDENVGTYEGVLDGAYTENSNYNVSVVKGDFTIRSQSINPNDMGYIGAYVSNAPSNVTYDGKKHKWRPELKDKDGNLLTEGTDYVMEYSHDTCKDVGTIIATIKGIGNYSGELTEVYAIEPRDVTIKANNAKKVYGEADPELTATVEGAVEGETLDYTLDRFRSEREGKHEIYVNTGYNPNYNVMTENGQLEIVKQSIDPDDEAYRGIEISKPENVTYDGNEHRWSPVVTDKNGNALIDGIDYELMYSRFDFTNAGEITVTIEGKGHYSGTETRRFAIEPREITIKADDSSKIYGTENPEFTSEITKGSLVNSYDLGEITVERASESEDAGLYEEDLEIRYFGNDNYKVTAVKGNFEIVRQSISPSDGAYSGIEISSPENATYDGEEHKWTPVVTDRNGNPLAEGTDYVVTYNTDDFTNSGEIEVTITGTGNYSGTETRKYSIEKASVTVKADDKTAVYGDSEPELTATVEGVKDDYTIEYQLEREAGTSAGTYSITGTGDEKQGNYEVTFEGGTFTILPASIDPESDNYRDVNVTSPESVRYDGSPHKWTPVVTDKNGSPLTEGTDYEVTYSTNDFVNSGEITVTITGKGNYEGSIERTYEIEDADVTVKADNKEKVFGEPDPEFTATVTGLAEGDSIEYDFSRDTSEAAGEHNITVSGSKTQGSYIIAFEGGILTIKSQSIAESDDNYRGVNVSDAPSGVIYDGEEHKWTPVITDKDGNPLTEGVDYEVTYNTDDFTDAGKVEVTITGKGNYSGEITRGYDIEPKKVTVKADNKEKVYGEPDPELTYTAEGVLASDSIEVSLKRENGEAAGEYAISIEADERQGNYEVIKTGDASLTIRKQSLSPESDCYRDVNINKPENITYDGKSHKWTPVITDKDGNPLTEGVDYEVIYNTDDFTNSGKIEVTVRGIGNFDGEVTRTYEIKRAKAIVKADDKTKKQGENDPKLTAKAEGLIEGDSVEYKLTRAKGEKVGTYTITATGEEVQGNYEVSFENGTLTITKADKKPVKPDNKDKNSTFGPKTGDENSLAMWISTMFASLLGLIALLFTRRRKDNEERNN